MIPDDCYVFHGDLCDLCVKWMPSVIQIHDYTYHHRTMNLCLECLRELIAKIEEEL